MMGGITAFGLFAVTAMLVYYALEERSPWFILAFAMACGLGSVYGFLQGAWPFGIVEAIWAFGAVRRWLHTWQSCSVYGMLAWPFRIVNSYPKIIPYQPLSHIMCDLRARFNGPSAAGTETTRTNASAMAATRMILFMNENYGYWRVDLKKIQGRREPMGEPARSVAVMNSLPVLLGLSIAITGRAGPDCWKRSSTCELPHCYWQPS